MRKLMDGIFERYGMPATIQTAAGEQPIKVFFHSVNSSSWQNMERQFSPLGEVPRGQYICVLPVHVAAEPEDTLTVAEKKYLLRRIEDMAMFTGDVYRWALCVEKGSEDTWGSKK
jgi:hypothetical protein